MVYYMEYETEVTGYDITSLFAKRVDEHMIVFI